MMDRDTMARWDRQREELRGRLVQHNTQQWQDCANFEGLKLVAGVDLSFVKEDEDDGGDGGGTACAAYVVCAFPSMEVVYEKWKMVELTVPYVPGYLAFRECAPLAELIRAQAEERPEVTPQVVMVDGNGILHNHFFGLACHLGVECDVPSVGVAKNLYQMNDWGLLRDEEHHRQIENLKEAGDSFDLVIRKVKSDAKSDESDATGDAAIAADEGDENDENDGRVLGAALKTCAQAKKPVFVSVGHCIDLATSLRLALACSRHRVPEPTRQADIRSREFIRKNSVKKN